MEGVGWEEVDSFPLSCVAAFLRSCLAFWRLAFWAFLFSICILSLAFVFGGLGPDDEKFCF